MIGKTIAHYRVTEKVGEGGMGVVYQATDTKINRTVALKFLPANLTRDAETKARFIREAQTAGQLDHPNVCTIHEIGETEDGQLFIAMAYYDGASLAEKLTDGPLPLAEALDVASQIAAGLDKAHAAGIVHRDIKPANILLTSDGLVKVVDFGLAKLTDQTNITKTGTTLGSGSYMAPEQASGEEADSRADIWSLAVVTYEMLTGQRPFKGDFLPAVVYAIVHEEPDDPSTINPELNSAVDDALMTGLAKDPADRFASAGELIEALGGEPGSITNRPRPKLKSKPADAGGITITRRWLMAVLGLVILASGYFGISRMQKEPLAGALAPPPENFRSLVILPFSFQGDEADQHIAGQFTQLMVDRLNFKGDLHVVAGDSLSPYLTSAERDGPDPEDLPETTARLKADLVMSGQVTVTQGNLQVGLNFANDRFFDVFSGPAASLDEILGYADQMALKSVPSLFSGEPHYLSRMVAAASDNWAAVSEFIDSERYHRSFSYPNWYAKVAACLQADSTMALAHYSQYMLAAWASNPRGMIDAARKARRHAHNLPEEGRNLIEAANLYSDHKIDDAENLINRTLYQNQGFLDAWLMRSMIQFKNNPYRGRSISESKEGLDRVLELDPLRQEPNLFMGFLLSRSGDLDALEKFWTPQDGTPMSMENQVTLAFNRNDIQLQEALVDSLDLASINNTYQFVLNSADNHWNSLRLLELLGSRPIGESGLGYVQEIQAHLEAGVGRWDRAKEHFAAVPPRLQPWRLTYQAITMSMPFTRCSPEEIRTHIQEVESWQPLAAYAALDPGALSLINSRYATDYALHPHMKEFSLGLLQTRLGDFEAARLALTRLEALAVPGGNAPMINEFVLSLRGWIAFEEGRFAEVLTILEGCARYALMDMHYSGLADRQYQRYLRALTLEKLGRDKEAAPWFENIDQKTERGLSYVAPAHLRLGRIFERTGDQAKALHHYRAFIDLYRECDERYQSLVDEARQRVVVLEAA